MDIREINIDRFGCWQDVSVRSFVPGLSIIHLDDGGRPVDFARFVHGVYFGYDEERHEPAAGSVVVDGELGRWTLQRTRPNNGEGELHVTSRDQQPRERSAILKEIRGSANSAIASRLLLPTQLDDVADAWEWLAETPAVLGSISGGSKESPARHPGLRAAAGIKLKRHGKVIERLAVEREQLLSEIAELRALQTIEQSAEEEAREQAAARQEAEAKAELQRAREAQLAAEEEARRTPPVKQQPPERKISNDVFIAELTDELRMLRRQIEPLKTAVSMANQWSELKKLKKRAGSTEEIKNLNKLERLLSKVQQLQEERKSYDTPKRRRKKRAATPDRGDEVRRIRKLLGARRWILESLEEPMLELNDELESTRSGDREFDSADELRHAGFLFEEAKRDSLRLENRLDEFSRRTVFDWTKLLEDEHPPLREISPDSAFAQDPPAVQLEELKRRRLWIREEHQWLLDRARLSTHFYVAIAILFTLSVASLFGTLLVVSLTAKWTLTALGIGGMVSSGAIRMALELRTSQQLCRVKDRLSQIDGEIHILTERVLMEKQDAEAVRRRAEEKLYALQLQQDVADARRRLDGAETGFRELLDRNGLPISYSPTEADRALRRRAQGDDLERTHSIDRRPVIASRDDAKLGRWIKAARKAIRPLDSARLSHDPMELLQSLDELLAELEYTRKRPKGSSLGLDREQHESVRDELKRIETEERSLLRRAGVDDAFELESAVREARELAGTRRRIETLDRELSVQLETHEDGEDIRDLLETFDGEDLRLRLADRQRNLEETDASLQMYLEPAPELPPTPKPVAHLHPEPPRSPEAPEIVVDTPRPVKTFDRHRQMDLDRLRMRLAVVETRIRRAMRTAQSGAVLRNVARQLLGEPQKEDSLMYLAELTGGRWTDLKPIEKEGSAEAAGFVLSNATQQSALVPGSQDSAAAWLAVQLNVAVLLKSRGAGIPLMLLADPLLASPDAARIFAALQLAAKSGIQILLLVGNRQLVNQLSESGTPVVRIGLEEDLESELPPVDAAAGF